MKFIYLILISFFFTSTYAQDFQDKVYQKYIEIAHNKLLSEYSDIKKDSISLLSETTLRDAKSSKYIESLLTIAHFKVKVNNGKYFCSFIYDINNEALPIYFDHTNLSLLNFDNYENQLIEDKFPKEFNLRSRVKEILVKESENHRSEEQITYLGSQSSKKYNLLLSYCIEDARANINEREIYLRTIAHRIVQNEIFYEGISNIIYFNEVKNLYNLMSSNLNKILSLSKINRNENNKRLLLVGTPNALLHKQLSLITDDNNIISRLDVMVIGKKQEELHNFISKTSIRYPKINFVSTYYTDDYYNLIKVLGNNFPLWIFIDENNRFVVALEGIRFIENLKEFINLNEQEYNDKL